jgi:phosphate transport system ATP-binding protein
MGERVRHDCAAHDLPLLAARRLGVAAGTRAILRSIDLQVLPHEILCLIGPSGSGKSTLLKCLNRLIDLEAGLQVCGEVTWRGRPVAECDPNELRTRIGIIFQQPVVFPGSICHNVLFGIRHLRRIPRRDFLEVAREALTRAALWQEVCDRLREPASTLSIGQQQRLCIARTLACEPEVVLMDEPTSALDPRSTEAIECLLDDLKRRHTLVVVTHSLPQAQRLADRIACLCVVDGAGQIMQVGSCEDIFDRPMCRDVEEYVRPRSSSSARRESAKFEARAPAPT